MPLTHAALPTLWWAGVIERLDCGTFEVQVKRSRLEFLTLLWVSRRAVWASSLPTRVLVEHHKAVLLVGVTGSSESCIGRGRERTGRRYKRRCECPGISSNHGLSMPCVFFPIEQLLQVVGMA